MSAFLLGFKANYLKKNAWLPLFLFLDSNSPFKDLDLLFPRGPNEAHEPLYLVITVLNNRFFLISGHLVLTPDNSRVMFSISLQGSGYQGSTLITKRGGVLSSPPDNNFISLTTDHHELLFVVRYSQTILLLVAKIKIRDIEYSGPLRHTSSSSSPPDILVM